MKKLFLLNFILLYLFSCQNTSKSPHAEKKHIEVQEINLNKKTLLFSEKILKTVEKENVIEFYQQFQNKKEKGEILSSSISLNLSKTTGAMLSAYSLDKGEYNVFFKVLENNIWSEWKELKINREVNNPKRKVFAPQNLTNATDSIQFMTNKATSEEIVFRIYRFLDQ